MCVCVYSILYIYIQHKVASLAASVRQVTVLLLSASIVWTAHHIRHLLMVLLIASPKHSIQWYIYSSRLWSSHCDGNKKNIVNELNFLGLLSFERKRKCRSNIWLYVFVCASQPDVGNASYRWWRWKLWTALRALPSHIYWSDFFSHFSRIIMTTFLSPLRLAFACKDLPSTTIHIHIYLGFNCLAFDAIVSSYILWYQSVVRGELVHDYWE